MKEKLEVFIIWTLAAVGSLLLIALAINFVASFVTLG